MKATFKRSNEPNKNDQKTVRMASGFVTPGIPKIDISSPTRKKRAPAINRYIHVFDRNALTCGESVFRHHVIGFSIRVAYAHVRRKKGMNPNPPPTRVNTIKSRRNIIRPYFFYTKPIDLMISALTHMAMIPVTKKLGIKVNASSPFGHRWYSSPVDWMMRLPVGLFPWSISKKP